MAFGSSSRYRRIPDELNSSCAFTSTSTNTTGQRARRAAICQRSCRWPSGSSPLRSGGHSAQAATELVYSKDKGVRGAPLLCCLRCCHRNRRGWCSAWTVAPARPAHRSQRRSRLQRSRSQHGCWRPAHTRFRPSRLPSRVGYLIAVPVGTASQPQGPLDFKFEGARPSYGHPYEEMGGGGVEISRNERTQRHLFGRDRQSEGGGSRTPAGLAR
jgi:hypothetical protein